MHGSQTEDNDEDKAREMVKSYVLTDYDTPIWRAYHDLVWNHD
jgi:hypothetical protein